MSVLPGAGDNEGDLNFKDMPAGLSTGREQRHMVLDSKGDLVSRVGFRPGLGYQMSCALRSAACVTVLC